VSANNETYVNVMACYPTGILTNVLFVQGGSTNNTSQQIAADYFTMADCNTNLSMPCYPTYGTMNTGSWDLVLSIMLEGELGFPNVNIFSPSASPLVSSSLVASASGATISPSTVVSPVVSGSVATISPAVSGSVATISPAVSGSVATISRAVSGSVATISPAVSAVVSKSGATISHAASITVSVSGATVSHAASVAASKSAQTAMNGVVKLFVEHNGASSLLFSVVPFLLLIFVW